MFNPRRVLGSIAFEALNGITDSLGWGYQDFAAGSGPNLTLTANENGASVVFESARVISGSAIIVRADDTDSFAYTGILALFSTKVLVNSHITAAIVLNAVPNVVWGELRVYYMYNYKYLPKDYTIAPKFIRSTNIIELDNLFVNEEEFAATFPLDHTNPLEITNVGTRTHADIDVDLDNLDAVYQATKAPTGFPNRTDSIMTFDNASRKFTINPVGASFSYWIDGEKFTISSSDVVAVNYIILPNTEGLQYIYFDGNTLKSTTTWNNNLLYDYALVSYVHWDATNSKQIYFAEERHGFMPWQTHVNLHNTDGTKLQFGGDLGDIIADGNGNLASHAQFSVVETSIHDEDINLILTARASNENIPIYYRFGNDADLIWRMNEGASYCALSTGTGRAAWNQLSAGVWSLAEVGNNQFLEAHVFAYNDPIRKFGIVMGQNTYGNVGEARDGAEAEINNIILEGAPAEEIKFLGTLIIQTSDSYGNAVKSRIRTTNEGADYIDVRGSVIGRSGVSAAVVTHNALAGLQGGTTLEYYHLTTDQYGVILDSHTATLQTSDATASILYTGVVAEGEALSIEIAVVGRKSDGSERAWYKLAGLFYRNAGGNITQQGATTNIATIESDAAWDCVLSAVVGTQSINVVVTGVAATIIDWKGLIKINKIS